MVQEGSTTSASEPERETIGSKPLEIGNDGESYFSPRFKSAAAMAGWDEEALLIASLVVEDTPDREFRQKKRLVLQCKSPLSGSRRKRRDSANLISIPAAVLDLEEEESTVKDDAPKQEQETAEADPKKSDSLDEQKAGASSSSSTCSTLPCMDKLREELSCAICLEICFEPSTTPCGHSFCKKCLRSAADKCGKKCPKCRQLISNGRSCTVNTVLWNTIQLLFPQEVEARKEAKGGCSSHDKKIQDTEKAIYNSSLQNHNTRATRTSSRHGSSISRRREITGRDEDDESNGRMMQQAPFSNAVSSRVQSRMHHRSVRPVRTTTRDADVSRRRGTPDQDQEAALALRLRREEFMEAFRDNNQVQTRSSSVSLARANLRALAARVAINR